MRVRTIIKSLVIPLALLVVAASLAAAARPDGLPWLASAQAWALNRNTCAQEAHKARGAGRSRVVAEGRVVTYPGGEVTLSAEYAGVVRTMAVTEMAAVRQGELIAQIGCEERHAELAEIRARIAECEADIGLAQWRMERAQETARTGASSRDEVREHTRNLAASRARHAALQAMAQRLEMIIGRFTIRAPIDGTVIARMANAGEMVSAGQALVTIADVSRTRIEAEVDEFDAGRVRVGAGVRIRSDGFPGTEWRGIVEEVPDVVVPRRLKPDDPSRPTDTRILLARIALEEPAPLKLGQRVELTMEASPAP
jgi:HlyD family secretion protein